MMENHSLTIAVTWADLPYSNRQLAIGIRPWCYSRLALAFS